MRISEKELKKLVREAVQKKIAASRKTSLKEGNDLTAKRKIDIAAQNKVLEMENEIISHLALQNPDDMNEDLQKRYLQIAENMKSKIIEAVREASGELVKFPRNQS